MIKCQFFHQLIQNQIFFHYRIKYKFKKIKQYMFFFHLIIFKIRNIYLIINLINYKYHLDNIFQFNFQ